MTQKRKLFRRIAKAETERPLGVSPHIKRRNLDRHQTADILGRLRSLIDDDAAELLLSTVATVPDLDDPHREQHSLFVCWLEDK